MVSDQNPVPILLSFLSRQHQDKSTQEIGEALGMNRNLVSKYLTILHMQGRVELRTYGTLKMYRISKRIPFQAISDIIEGLCIGIDRLLIVREAGTSFSRFFPEDLAGLDGKKCTELSHPCFTDESFIKHLRMLLEGKQISDTLHEFRKDQICHRVRIYPTVFNDGSPGVAITFTDCSEEKNYVMKYQVSGISRFSSPKIARN